MRTDIVRKIEQEINNIQSKYYKIILVCEHQKGNSVQYIGQVQHVLQERKMQDSIGMDLR